MIKSYLVTQKHWLVRHEAISYHFKQNLFTILTTFSWSHQMLTPQIIQKYSYASQFTKHMSSMNLEGDTIHQLQNKLKPICYAFCLSLSTNKSWTSYKYLTPKYYYIYSFVIPSDTQFKLSTSTGKYQELSISLWVHLFRYETIPSSKAPKSSVKLITYMNIDNIFDLLVGVLFSISP